MELCFKATKSAARPDFRRLSARILAQQRAFGTHRSVYLFKQTVSPPNWHTLPGLCHTSRLNSSMSAAGEPLALSSHLGDSAGPSSVF